MTSTRSARNTASGIECVISSTVLPVSRWIRISSTFMRSRVMASSAPNGSSISMILGSCTSARQIEARCCMPPDNCQGSFLSNPSRPTSFNRSIARGRYLSRGNRFMSIGSMTLLRMLRQGKQQRVLEHDADIAVGLCHLLAFDQDLAGRGCEQPGDHLQKRGLAAAGRADHDKELAFIDVEIQRPQRRHIAIARPVGLRDAGERDARLAGGDAIRHQAQMRARLIDLRFWSLHSFKRSRSSTSR